MNSIKNVVELSNIEIHEHCMLNLKTGEKEYNRGKKKIPYFTGVYFRDENTFFALYPTKSGPIIYYEGDKYPLKKELQIDLIKTENNRIFSIKEYNISIKYKPSLYVGFDVWSEEDVDLFYQIEHSYKNEDFYKKFTSKC